MQHLILLSITAVSAHDSDAASIGNTTATFSDLSDEIAKTETGGVLNLTRNYIYDSGNATGITIEKTMTINGNGHVLDGDSQSRIFTQNKGHLILNDLVLVNGKSSRGGAIYSDGTITLNNVVFKSNHADEGGALYSGRGISINDCVFDENHAKNGAAIYMTYIETGTGGTYTYKITNSTFKNSHNITKGLIYADIAEKIEIKGSTFRDSSSEFATAVFCMLGCEFEISNSTFENLHSTKSGGVFLFQQTYRVTITDSRFINDSSDTTSGAIYAMLKETFSGNEFEMIIKSSEFRNLKAHFGGAITQMSGNLTIEDTIFDNNTAISGGAIYALDCIQTVKNSTFTNNRADATKFKGNSAAINVFSRSVKIDNSRFENNTDNAIYCAESTMAVTNSYFRANGKAIETAYDKKRTLKNNEYNGDRLVLNDTKDYYVLIINSTGVPLKLVDNGLNLSSLPSRYDSRLYNWTTPVKDQGGSGACWVFSTCGALETALLRQTGMEFDFSEQNIEKNLMLYSKYGDSEIINGGFEEVAAEYLLSWYGPVPDEFDRFDEYAKVSVPIISNSTVHIQDVVWLDKHTDDSYINEFKHAIYQYGSVITGIVTNNPDPYLNNATNAMYHSKKSQTNHAVCIVGWDDDYPAENFLKTPPGNGAWIIKNSYGADEFDNGYIYVSYYDQAIGTDKKSLSYPIINVENYHKNYQTDIGGQIKIETKSGKYSYKNVYTSIEDDVICAVGTYFSKENESYTLKLYVNGKLRHTQTGKAPFRGFHTVKLTKDIGIKKGDKFTVVMEKSSVPLLKMSMQHFEKATSYYNTGNGWIDLATKSTTASLKVYTKEHANLTTGVDPQTVSVEYKSNGKVVVTVNDIYGNPLEGVNVTVRMPTGEVKNMTTNSKGQIKVKVSTSQIKTLKVKITTPAFGDYVRTTSTVKVKVTKIATKMTAKGKTFKAKTKVKKIKVTLKDSGKKAIKKAKVALKVNGKTYSAKTNSKGVATLKITKLTKKGNFNAKVKYAGSKYYKAVTKTIKIKAK